MTDPDRRRCGTCRWWLDNGDEEMLPNEGTDCPTWEARDA